MDTSNACRQGNTTRIRIITAALGLLLAHGTVAQYAGGTGIEGAPYIIATVQDLLDLSNSADWDKYCLMTNDIDMDCETGFRPIGTDTLASCGARAESGEWDYPADCFLVYCTKTGCCGFPARYAPGSIRMCP